MNASSLDTNDLSSSEQDDATELSTRKLLAVSFAYPPAASPRAVQVARLLKYLKMETTLVCADFEDKDRIDASLVRAAEAPLKNCLRVPLARSSLRTLAGRVGYRFNLPLVDKTPDAFTVWKPSAIAAVKEFVASDDYRPDVLATFGSPMSDHLIGLELKRVLRVPWVAHFSDPWADNPFLGYDALTKRINRSLEAKVFRAADLLVFTSHETIDLVMSHHAPALKTKTRVLSHAFEPEFFPAQGARERSRLVIRYLGDFYGERSPAPLFRALKKMLSEDDARLEGVRFELVGSKGEGQLEAAGLNSLPEGLVVSRPSVGYHESLRLMTESDGLLVIDAPAEVSVFLPSKLIDYVGAARPVFGITPRGTAYALIQRLGGWVAAPSDDETVARELKNFIDFLRLNKDERTAWGDEKVRRSFEAQAVAETFAKILREALA